MWWQCKSFVVCALGAVRRTAPSAGRIILYIVANICVRKQCALHKRHADWPSSGWEFLTYMTMVRESDKFIERMQHNYIMYQHTADTDICRILLSSIWTRLSISCTNSIQTSSDPVMPVITCTVIDESNVSWFGRCLIRISTGSHRMFTNVGYSYNWLGRPARFRVTNKWKWRWHIFKSHSVGSSLFTLQSDAM